MTVAADLRPHGDKLAAADLLDFAVNVWPGERPDGVASALERALRDPRYPDERPAREAVAGRYARPVEEVLLLNVCNPLWSPAGVRAGYLLAEPDLLAGLAASRRPWSINALVCSALEWCAVDRRTPIAVATAVATAHARLREDLAALGRTVWPLAANFLLLELPGGEEVARRLRERGIAVRPAARFRGLGPDHLRIAVRPPEGNALLPAALSEVLA